MSPSAARPRPAARGRERPDRDDYDRRRHQRRQGHLCGDRDEWRVVGQRDRGAGASPGRRQLQHQGECVGCGRQCGDHGEPGDSVDETAPTIAITSPVAGDNIINKSEAAAGVTISGTATAGSGRGQRPDRDDHDRRQHQHRQGHLYGDGDAGTWSVNVTAAQAQALADGSYSIKANVSDAAGNAATTASQTITVDTLAPTVLISTTGTTTNQATQTISGTVAATEAAAGSTVTLFDTVNSVTTQIGTATVVGGSWSTTVTLSGNGTHSIVAKDTDAIGNIGSSSPVVFTLSTAAPTIAITAPVAGDNIINRTEAAAGVTISGTATAGRRCGGQRPDGDDHDRRQHQCGQGHLHVDGDGRHVVGERDRGAGAGLADGTYSIKANVSDAVGNAATTATQAITVDETAPTIGDEQALLPGTTSSTRARRRPALPSVARPRLAARRSTARPRRSRSSTAPMRSRTPMRRR